MNKNAVFTGFLTGVAIIATLFYPLYVVLPGAYLTGWATGSESLALILTIVTAVIIVAGGMLATRWGGSVTWHTGPELGAVAGGIAGIMAFAALGAASAGTVSLGNTLLSGAESSTLDAVIETANLTFAALWGMLLWGAALGALGGFVASPVSRGEKQEDESAIRIAEVLSNRLLLVSLLIVIVSVATTPMLMRSENLGLQENMDVVFNRAVGSGFVVSLAVQLWILHLARRKSVPNQGIFRKRQVKGWLWFASLISILALIVMVVVLFFNGRFPENPQFQLLINPIFLTGAMACIALSGYMLKTAVGLSRELRNVGKMTPAEEAQAKEESSSFVKRENILLVMLMGGTAFGLPPLTLVPLVINLARGVIPTAAGGTTVYIVRDLFLWQAAVAYGIFLLGAISILSPATIAWGITRFRQRSSHSGKTQQD